MSSRRYNAWSRLVLALRRFYTSRVRRQAIGWSFLLLAVLLSINGLNVLNSYVGRDFMSAVSERRPRAFATYALLYLGVFAALTVAAVLSRYAEERLRLLWRAWVTRALIDGYFSDHVYLRLNALEEVDNPDQRITDDVKSYTQTTLSFFLLSLNGTITSLAFLGVLWSITPWLVLAAFVLATAGTAASILIGRSLVRLDNLQLKKEADLRYGLIQVREASESIAVLHVERAVRASLLDRLAEVVDNNRRIIAVTRNLGFCINGYNYLIQLVPLLIVAPLYMRGKVEFGAVTQSAMAFAQVLGAFSLIVTQFETLSSFAAVSDRLNAIVDAIEEAQAPRGSEIELAEDDDRVAFETLSLRTPKEGRLLVRELSLSVSREPANTLLVAGPGAALSALFLATAGAWDAGQGRIVRPPGEGILFVPHRPFAIRGSLREQFLLTISGPKPDDHRILEVAQALGLEPVLARAGGLDAVQDWLSALSSGELQLIAVARVILARPRFVFLDRVAQAIRPEQADRLYEALDRASIVYLSTGEEQRLKSYHQTVLELNDDASWRARPAHETSAT